MTTQDVKAAAEVELAGPGVSGTNPFVFVVGCQRSGTTMLQRILDAHPQLAVAYDSLFIPRVIKGEPIGCDPVMDEQVLAMVRGHPRFDRLGLDEPAVERAADGAARYSDFVRLLYDELGRKHGKPLAGEKSPGYCRHLPRLCALLPWVKIVHLIRDGRDVALSIRDWGKGAAKLELWKDEPIAAAALWWKRDVKAGTQDGHALGADRYCEVRYEALVGETRQSVERLCAFLGLPFAESMLEYHKGKVREKAGLRPKAAWLPPTRGVRDWRTQMSDRDRQVFEAIAGEELAMLGYERSCDSIGAEAKQVAEQATAWWVREMG